MCDNVWYSTVFLGARRVSNAQQMQGKENFATSESTKVWWQIYRKVYVSGSIAKWNLIVAKVDEKDFSPALLEKTSTLLRKNPEYYTIWNVRRRIFNNEFNNINRQADQGQLSEDNKYSQVLDIINLDLQFIFPLLLQYPKCYWIWNHRVWLLQQASKYLLADRARSLWEDELKLVSKMLGRDSRNFHGWGYRRIVVENLEDRALNGKSMARDEYDYTTKMIGQNLSNFSAWHNRSRLILCILDEERASTQERQEMLDEEIKFIHKALFDPYDQSLWFYHQHLLSTFDPDIAGASMMPDLSNESRLTYVKAEQEFIEDLIEDVEDSKWVYQALIECALIEAKLVNGLSEKMRTNIKVWLDKLKQLDPLRRGRWIDTEQRLLKDMP
ncbi:Rab geranylgeranyltransferase [Lithohypha guttulata]|uniref:Geranylgeranyl transferase type-2 subunit alpha n=1 Tax=Lithohypha guttulata TaxID=1690604 RepID=A0AAN7T0X6_9EURO|nr:Rab geranylgeranyltransferase [Lithohypha guttulata]